MLIPVAGDVSNSCRYTSVHAWSAQHIGALPYSIAALCYKSSRFSLLTLANLASRSQAPSQRAAHTEAGMIFYRLKRPWRALQPVLPLQVGLLYTVQACCSVWASVFSLRCLSVPWSNCCMRRPLQGAGDAHLRCRCRLFMHFRKLLLLECFSGVNFRIGELSAVCKCGIRIGIASFALASHSS